METNSYTLSYFILASLSFIDFNKFSEITKT